MVDNVYTWEIPVHIGKSLPFSNAEFVGFQGFLTICSVLLKPGNPG